MDLLTVEHEDFTLSVVCQNFDRIWGKATKNVGIDNLNTTYSWSDPKAKVSLANAGKELVYIEQNQSAPAIFFDNADYPIWVDFNKNVSIAEFGSNLLSENEKFGLRKNILSGCINYKNEIGRSEIVISYRIGSETRHFTFSFEVLSTKLNYHEHWKKIVEDIEQEYRLLSLDYMRRTYHGFSPENCGETPEIIWWSIFKEEQNKFIQACRRIIERPRHKLQRVVNYERADKLKRITSDIENEFNEHSYESSHLYRVESQFPSNDTQENRFLKYALKQIADKHDSIRKDIQKLKDVAPSILEEITADSITLKRLQKNAFFRTVGNFKGLNQESLILQKASGYSQVYRTWNLLRRSYSLNDGIYRLQTKDIATLYEIWCFIEVSHIVKDLLKQDRQISDEDIEHQNRMELNGLFSWELGRGEHSKILFKKDGIELAELIYNPKHTEKINDNISIDNLYVPTVAQKPDIVLRLTKNDLQKDIKLTYLFDAKYRIDGKDKNVDVPPEDAINQMHRYRDAIYYKEYGSNALKKEVIGGYILFPGDGQPDDVAISKFYNTIDEVNIGAFPLRPCDEKNRAFLEEFIEKLISDNTKNILDNVIPQKGTTIEVNNRVLVGVVRPSSRTGYQKSFDNQTATLYYTGKNFPTTIPLQGLRYFMPYISGKGIKDLYEITRIRTIAASDAKQIENDGNAVDDLRLAFELKFESQLFADYKKFNVNIKDTFADTTFEILQRS